MVADTIYESGELRVPIVQIAVMRLDMRMLCHDVHDFTDDARVAVSPVPLKMRPACRKSLKPMKVIPPNSIHGRLLIALESDITGKEMKRMRRLAASSSMIGPTVV
ncbi:hypothetical protein BDR07DRAFT_1421325, partial [Suillus spraguei]